jgi:predicted histidine transporter YuiF (NhaC family)
MEMEKDYKGAIIFGLTMLVGLLVVTTLFFAKEYSDQKTETKQAQKAAVIVKIDSNAKKERVLRVLNSRFKFTDKPVRNIQWLIQGQMISQDSLFLTYGITTAAQKEKVIKAFFKFKYERFVQECNEIDGPKVNWSLGYCTLEPYPQEETA